VIFGYTWNVRTLHDDTPIGGSNIPTPAGDYRINFSFDQMCGAVGLKTYFVEGTTQIIVPLETEEVAVAALEGEDTGAGADGVLVPAIFDESGALTGGNLTYMDVRILERGGGGGGGGKNPRPTGGESATCDCNCACVGEQCTCTCEEACDCSCDCQGEECNCACEAPGCAQCRTQIRAIEQLQMRLQTQCPGETCPCTDLQGDICQQFRAQLTNLVNAMHQMQLRTVCDGEACHCICQNGEACLQVQTELQTMLQQQEQLTMQSTSGACVAEPEYFAALSAAMAAVNEVLATMEQDFQIYLPSVSMPD
jgi:hypothetical protein